MSDIINPYAQLCTEFYDLTKPEASQEEVNFFAEKLKTISGPILEPMCGSGRLMIPLLKRGFDIEGTDRSVPMLELAHKKMNALGFNPILHEQSIELLDLPKKYGAIIIPFGSFQLLYDWDVAYNTLKRLHDHLLPGGLLLLDTFIPWQEICSTEPIIFDTSVTVDEQTIITMHTETIAERDAQQSTTHTTYQKIKNNQIVQTEKEEFKIRWFYHHELLLMLEKLGFANITAHKVDFEQDPQGIIYEVYKK